MQILMVIVCLVSWPVFAMVLNRDNDTVLQGNTSASNKDMYVINAMVYQVGIVTNRTDNDTATMNTKGNQEAFTFFKNNGSTVDLSQIPDPLVTNVTAQSLVGVAPVSSSQSNSPNQLPWSTFSQLTNKASPQTLEQGSKPSNKFVREVESNNYEDSTERSIDNIYKSFFKRDISEGNTPVEMRKGAAFIPQTAGVQSIAIPTLLTLNNNMSQIPVPIPNTSVVHYAKINTLLTSPST